MYEEAQGFALAIVLNAHATNDLPPKCDKPNSNFAFKFTLRRCNKGLPAVIRKGRSLALSAKLDDSEIAIGGFAVSVGRCMLNR